MVIEKIDTGRAIVRRFDGGIEAIIPSRKRWFWTAFLGFWLCGWAVGEISVLVELSSRFAGTGSGTGIFAVPHASSESTHFLLMWLAFWTFFGGVALSTFLWGLVGKERVVLAEGVLSVERRIPFWVRRRTYNAAEVGVLRATRVPSTQSLVAEYDPMTPFVGGFQYGTVKFDDGKVRWGFGLELDVAEARVLVAELNRYLTR